MPSNIDPENGNYLPAGIEYTPEMRPAAPMSVDNSQQMSLDPVEVKKAAQTVSMAKQAMQYLKDALSALKMGGKTTKQTPGGGMNPVTGKLYEGTTSGTPADGSIPETIPQNWTEGNQTNWEFQQKTPPPQNGGSGDLSEQLFQTLPNYPTAKQ